jgi:hypothetical protein
MIEDQGNLIAEALHDFGSVWGIRSVSVGDRNAVSRARCLAYGVEAGVPVLDHAERVAWANFRSGGMKAAVTWP